MAHGGDGAPRTPSSPRKKKSPDSRAIYPSRAFQGDLASITTGSSIDPNGFYAIQDSPNLTPAVFRFTLDLPRTFTIKENETLTNLEDNEFTLPSGSWSLLDSPGATVSNPSASTIDFHGTSSSPMPGAYTIQGTAQTFDFQITNSPGISSYGSAISLSVVPEPSCGLLLGLTGTALFARRRSARGSFRNA